MGYRARGEGGAGDDEGDADLVVVEMLAVMAVAMLVEAFTVVAVHDDIGAIGEWRCGEGLQEAADLFVGVADLFVVAIDLFGAEVDAFVVLVDVVRVEVVQPEEEGRGGGVAVVEPFHRAVGDEVAGDDGWHAALEAADDREVPFGEALVEAVAGEEVSVGWDAGGVVAVLLQAFGEGGVLGVDIGPEVGGAFDFGQVAADEQRWHRGSGLGSLGECPLEVGAAGGEGVEVGGCVAGVAEVAEVVGAEGVDRDEDDVRAVGEWG